MNDFPDTHHSLLVQLRDPANRDAWDRFVETYRPVMVRMALARGMQHADAHDMAQQVLIAVAGAVGNWERRGELVRFRHWLSRVVKNAILNALMRCPLDRAVGGTSVEELLREVEAGDEATLAMLEMEYRREMYLQAAEVVRGEFREDTWQAFAMTVMGGKGIEETAAVLGKSLGAVYTARSRVMYRLRELIAEWREEES